MFDPTNSITLLIPVPYFRQMAYVSIDEMVVEVWISSVVVSLRLPVAVATLRDKTSAGIPIVTRERVTDIKYIAPPPSSYARYRDIFPMVPDPVLQDYLKEDLTYRAHTSLAMKCQA